MLAIMGGAAFVIDVPVARWFKTGGMPGDVAKIFYLAEVMAHGVGVLGVIVTILVLDTSTRKTHFALCASYLPADSQAISSNLWFCECVLVQLILVRLIRSGRRL